MYFFCHKHRNINGTILTAKLSGILNLSVSDLRRLVGKHSLSWVSWVFSLGGMNVDVCIERIKSEGRWSTLGTWRPTLTVQWFTTINELCHRLWNIFYSFSSQTQWELAVTFPPPSTWVTLRPTETTVCVFLQTVPEVKADRDPRHQCTFASLCFLPRHMRLLLDRCTATFMQAFHVCSHVTV